MTDPIAQVKAALTLLRTVLEPIVANANFYKPEVPFYEKVKIPLDYLRAVRTAAPDLEAALPAIDTLGEELAAKDAEVERLNVALAIEVGHKLDAEEALADAKAEVVRLREALSLARSIIDKHQARERGWSVIVARIDAYGEAEPSFKRAIPAPEREGEDARADIIATLIAMAKRADDGNDYSLFRNYCDPEVMRDAVALLAATPTAPDRAADALREALRVIAEQAVTEFGESRDSLCLIIDACREVARATLTKDTADV